MSEKILIVDDQLLVRQALVAMIEKYSDHKIIGETDNGESALELTAQLKPSLVILDICMPIMDGEQVAKEIYKIAPNVLILALSGLVDKARIGQLFHAGIDGFLSKDEINHSSLNKAINTVVAGDFYLSPIVFAEEISNGVSIKQLITESINTQLTKREKAVIVLLGEGMSNSEIGEKLFISDKTVAKHRENIMRKSGSNTIAQLINYAKRAGFVQ